MQNSNSKAGTNVPTSTNADVATSSQTIAKPNVERRFSVDDTVNYCNGLVFKIVKIDDEYGTCYDSRGMWYALSNCVNLSQNGV